MTLTYNVFEFSYKLCVKKHIRCCIPTLLVKSMLSWACKSHLRNEVALTIL